MANNHLRDKQSRKRDAVAHFLHQRTRRAQSRRSDVRSTVVVDYDSDNKVDSGDDSLAYQHRASVVSWISHLGCNGKERWRAREGEDYHRDS